MANSERSLVKETGQSFPETDMFKKIEDLRRQTKQLAMKSQQRILDESKMNVKTWPIAEKQRELRAHIERCELNSNRGQTILPQTEIFTLNTEQDVQDSSLPIKEECISGDIQSVQNEEQADLRKYIRELEDRLLKHKRDEEAKEIDQLAKLYKQEAEMRKEMKEREKKWNSNTPRLYSQWLNSVIYWLINHCTDWALIGVTSFGRQFKFHDVIYHIRHCDVDNRQCNVVFITA